MTIGNRICQLRKSKGYTQEYVADQLGVSRQAVSKWEQDQTSPDTKNLIALAQLLDTSVEYIATGKIVRDSTNEDWKIVRQINRLQSAGTWQILLAVLIIIAGILMQNFLLILIAWVTGIILFSFGVVNIRKAMHTEEDWREEKRRRQLK